MKRIVQTFVTGSTCFLMLSSSIFAAHAENSNSTYSYGEDEMEVPEEMLLQEDALNAYNTLYSTFEIDENYNYVLPDDYAGEYINDDYKLVIQLTTDDYSYYETILSDYDCVEFRTVEFSYNDLKKLALDARNIICKEDSVGYISSGVNIKTNKATVEIGLYPSDINNISRQNQKINALSLNKPLEIKYTTTENNYSSYFGESHTTQKISILSSGSVTLIGGNGIQDGQYYTTISTMAICGTYKGKNAILTSGHGVHMNNNVFCDNVNIGTVSFCRNNNNQYGDFGIVTLNSNAVVTNKVKYKDGTVPISSTVYSVPAGTKCCTYGEASGFTQVSTLETRDIDFDNDNDGKVDITIKGLVASEIIYGQSLQGDSGGPYYVLQNGKWVFCGVHAGSSKYQTYFTPYLHIYGTFTAKTS